jgi:hypothetical protein
MNSFSAEQRLEESLGHHGHDDEHGDEDDPVDEHVNHDGPPSGARRAGARSRWPVTAPLGARRGADATGAETGRASSRPSAITVNVAIPDLHAVAGLERLGGS